MEYICHRINKLEELKNIEPVYGVEIDLRDAQDGEIYLNHDPFSNGDSLEAYLQSYVNGTLILNIKSERIEFKVIELLKKYHIHKYFFLDCSFPMTYLLSEENEHNIAVRFSEFETVENVLRLKNRVKWIWVDCFTELPITKEIYMQFKSMNYKLCLVSPELQGQAEKIEEYASFLKENKIEFDAICTKHKMIGRWKSILEI